MSPVSLVEQQQKPLVRAGDFGEKPTYQGLRHTRGAYGELVIKLRPTAAHTRAEKGSLCDAYGAWAIIRRSMKVSAPLLFFPLIGVRLPGSARRTENPDFLPLLSM